MKYTKAQIIEKADGEFTAVASTEDKDRHGEVVKADGWDLKNYKNNPILLFMHDHTKPIGKATKVWVDKSGKPKLMFKGVISSATEQARAAKQLMQEGILNSFSVGFMPTEMDGITISKSELHEISLVSVPANAEARLIAMKALKGFDESVVKEFIPDETPSVEGLEKRLAEIESELQAVKDTAETAVKGLKYLASPKPNAQVVNKRLRYSRIVAKTADKLIESNSSAKEAKIIKLAGEKLIQSHKGDL